jgi:hypothetical protein
MKELECLGGPADGIFIPVEDESAVKDMCMVRLVEGTPYFYITAEREDGTIFFDYAGTSPYDAVDKLRAAGCADADEIASRLDEQLGGRENFN